MADFRPPDDATIPNDEKLYIRIFPSPDVVQPAPDGGQRPNSGGVKPRFKDEPVSVDLGSVCTAEETRDRGTNGNFHVAMVTAGAIRALGLRVTRNPLGRGDEGGPNPAHALIHGSRQEADEHKRGGLTKGEYERVARSARFVIITPQAAA